MTSLTAPGTTGTAALPDLRVRRAISVVRHPTRNTWRLALGPRNLQIGLGLLWLLDGALQLQPFMFTTKFARTIIAPSGAGQTSAIHEPVHWAASLLLGHPVALNVAFAGIQLLLGVGLFLRQTVRLALVGSVGWGLSVWWLGEGLGGLAVPGTSILDGAPGAALLYAVIAVLAWPTRPTSAQRRDHLARIAWSTLWLGAAALELLGRFRHHVGLGATFADAGGELTGWIGHVDRAITNLNLGTTATVGFAVGCILIAALSLGSNRQTPTAAITVGIVIAVFAWVVVQGFGELTSGEATDPNTGPLIVLLGLAAVRPLRRTRW